MSKARCRVYQLFLLHGILTGSYGIRNREDLLKYLDSVDPRLRPAKNPDEPIYVNISLRPYQLLSVEWISHNIYWDPEKFENLSKTTVGYHAIWRPDTYLYNNLEMEEEVTVRHMDISIKPIKGQNASLVELMYPAKYKTSCTMDVSDFPFDLQDCALFFGSWSYDGTQIYYLPKEANVTLDYFIPNQQWDIVAFYSDHVISRYDCCPEPYTMVSFRLLILRKPLFYTINLIVPSVVVGLINFIGFFTLSSSSGDRNEKVTLGITTLLALGVLLLQLADHTPHSSTSVPLIGSYILCLLLLVGIATILTTIIISLQNKAVKKASSSRRVRQFIRLGNKFLRLSRWDVDYSPALEIEDSSSDLSGSELSHTDKKAPASPKKRKDYLEWSVAADVLERICFIFFMVSTFLQTVWLCWRGYSILKGHKV